jgi:hypothetical protein
VTRLEQVNVRTGLDAGQASRFAEIHDAVRRVRERRVRQRRVPESAGKVPAVPGQSALDLVEAA